MNEDKFVEINEKFFNYFESSFDKEMRTPQLLRCGFEEAFRLTIATNFTYMKPFLVYLHDRSSEGHEIFFMQNICNDIICDYLLNENWPIWPVDVSDKTERSDLLKLMGNRSGVHITSNVYELPILLMITREGFDKWSCNYMCSKDPMTIVSQLVDEGGNFKVEIDMRVMMIKSKEDKRKFEQMKKEEEHKEKLAFRKKQLEEQKIENEKEEIKINRENQINFAKNQVKDIESSPNNFMIRFRLPKGETVNREFSESQTVNDVLYFVESLEYLRSEVKVMISFPSKNMCEEDVTKNLKEAGFSKKETVNVQMKQ